MESTNLKLRAADPKQVDDALRRALSESLWIDDLPPIGVEEIVHDIHQALSGIGCVLLQLDADASGDPAIAKKETRDEDNRHNEEPEKWCRAPLCRMTNTCGYDRLHLRGPRCPPYEENPAPNPSAEFWEAIRESARQNTRHRRGLA